MLLRVESSQLRWFGHLIRMPPSQAPPLGGFLGTSDWEENPGADSELAGGIIIYPIWPGNASGSPRRSWRALLERRTSGGGPCLACCHGHPAPEISGRMDGWIHTH